jgi:hypothetical protein
MDKHCSMHSVTGQAQEVRENRCPGMAMDESCCGPDTSILHRPPLIPGGAEYLRTRSMLLNRILQSMSRR